MTEKFRQIIETLKNLVNFNVDKSMSDADFIANIDAVNLLCDLYDNLKIDCSEIRQNMDKLYPHFSRRIKSKENIQLAMPLIKALDRYIYDRCVSNANRGPAYRRRALEEMCAKVVEAYREVALIHSADYLYALCVVFCSKGYVDKSECQEITNILGSYLKDINEVSTDEKLRRLNACNKARGFVNLQNNDLDEWTDVQNSFYATDVRSMDDETFVMWSDATAQMPTKELKRRSGHSNAMHVEYLRVLAADEFERISRIKQKQKLRRDLKTLNDDIIGDIIEIKIKPDMSIATLYALEATFYMRLQLAQMGWEDNEPIYYALCVDRFEKLYKALIKKYPTVESLDEKIEILNRIEHISSTLNLGYSDFVFENREELLSSENLTYCQRYRLLNHSDCDSNTLKEDIDRLLRNAESAFDIAILFDIDSLGTETQRTAVMECYKSMFDQALANGNTAELANLLVVFSFCNINPHRRTFIVELTQKVVDDVLGLTLPESRINAIAAEIYTQIDKITGKYDSQIGISA